MGKMKGRRKRGSRYNPMAVRTSSNNSVRNNGDSVRTERNVAGLVMIQEKIDSHSAEERVCGLKTLAALALEDTAVNVIITTAPELMDKVATLLMDVCVDVRLSAALALRNMSTSGTEEAVNCLTHTHILSHLSQLLDTNSSSNILCVSEKDRERDPSYNALIHVVHTLWNLCQWSEIAVTHFNKSGLSTLLSRHLVDPSLSGLSLSLSASQLLLCVSESNPVAVTTLRPLSDQLLSLLSREIETVRDMMYKTTIAGILLNIHDGCNNENLQVILHTVSTTLQPDPVPELARVLAARTHTQGDNNSENIDMDTQTHIESDNSSMHNTDTHTASSDSTHDAASIHTDITANIPANSSVQNAFTSNTSSDTHTTNTANTPSISTKTHTHTQSTANTSIDAHTPARNLIASFEDLEQLVLAQQLAFELLSNICCQEDEEEEEDDWNNTLSEDEMDDADDSMDLVGENGATIETLPPEILEGIRHYELFKIATMRSNLETDELRTTSATYNSENTTHLLAKFEDLRVRALVCVQNMVCVLELPDIGGPERVYTTWLNLAALTFNNTHADTKILEASTGTMRALLDRLKEDTETDTNKMVSVTQCDLQTIFDAGATCAVGSVRANLVRMVGTLACLLISQNTQEKDVLIAIASFLLKVAREDTELFVSAESIDTLIDVFSDDWTDSLSREIDLVDRLKEITPHFKAKLKRERESLAEHQALILTVRDNLVSFIKYKGKRLAKK